MDWEDENSSMKKFIIFLKFTIKYCQMVSHDSRCDMRSTVIIIIV